MHAARELETHGEGIPGEGIPLTGVESRISVGVLNSSEMSIPRTTKRHSAVPLWQIFTCIILVGL